MSCLCLFSAPGSLCTGARGPRECGSARLDVAPALLNTRRTPESQEQVFPPQQGDLSDLGIMSFLSPFESGRGRSPTRLPGQTGHVNCSTWWNVEGRGCLWKSRRAQNS